MTPNTSTSVSNAFTGSDVPPGRKSGYGLESGLILGLRSSLGPELESNLIFGLGSGLTFGLESDLKANFSGTGWYLVLFCAHSYYILYGFYHSLASPHLLHFS